ncbi:nucleoside hydrolase [Glycomyces tarimensis]
MNDERRDWEIGTFPWLGSEPPAPPGVRVIVDNDFAGDPDDLFQLAHHLLSPSVEIRAVIGSHLRPGDAFHPGPGSAASAVAKVEELLGCMGTTPDGIVVAGAEEALEDRSTPRPSAATEAILAEARRGDPRPLYVACGGGLTDIASAYLMDPSIAERLTVVWIGGPEYPDLAPPPPGANGPEYNLSIDPVAAQVVFNDSALPLWQVPRNAYRQCLVADIELRDRVAAAGRLGSHLYRALRQVDATVRSARLGYPATYALGDSPLVLLTAQQSYFEPDPSSSEYLLRPAPVFDGHGGLSEHPDGRMIRVYTRLDNRLMFEDLFLKLRAFHRWQASASCTASS